MPPYKPAGYTSASPYLIVSDAASTIDVLEKVLGAKLLRSFPDDQGRLMHAAAYARALGAGAESVQALVEKGDEDKRGGVKDSGGTNWWLATKVEQSSVRRRPAVVARVARTWGDTR